MKILFLVFLFVQLILSSNSFSQKNMLVYNGNNTVINRCIARANLILSSQWFYYNVSSVAYFAGTTYTGEQIAEMIKNYQQNIDVKTYWNPFGRANAKTRDIIKINSAKLKRHDSLIVQTLVHETVHAVDWWMNKSFKFSSDTNSGDSSRYTPSYIIEKLAWWKN